jgi:hypothetical protein
MQRIIQSASEIVLFLVLFIAVTGFWTCLWLPPR